MSCSAARSLGTVGEMGREAMERWGVSAMERALLEGTGLAPQTVPVADA